MCEPYLGQIIMFGGNFPIRDWAPCDGQLLPVSQNAALFSILGTTFGGDGRTSFGLPDLRGRFPLHRGTGPGLPPYQLGNRGGTHQTALAENQMPSHNHGYAVPAGTDDGSYDSPEGNYPARAGSDIYTDDPDAELGAATTNLKGGGQALNLMNPFLAIQFLIALAGILPPRQ